ncbi:type IV conjugative transfer system protein TraE [Legionella pneumophila]|uniref:Putative conjugative transfer protein TraE n=1 Tax=Legionella worsleiensis TaxID=45076 RepID=A0A0W1AKH0_9GAMM|nr:MULTISPECIES: type IV conjugative transfer system protein TraE [Legionella]HAT9146617.1 type IV conjugative transfer system protein TraE [Legionella pneumophila subsp. pneumophila]KTD81853.1 putative conjugative transfer protein TraE [Legionella worsleiensis]MCW8398134.1 type IV conjugative transfer system protein TraE [Legionella sp. PATHC038]MCW8431915.1 type IV conjugative transfer system protein TraE [Legionella pneumophila]STY30964.1 putative conjugative transfer protein TraE [Legionel
MKIEQKKSELMKEKKIRVLFIGISSVLLAMTFMQSITIVALLHYAHSKHETHFIPPKISQEFTLSGTGVSEGYLRDMTNFLTQLRFNITSSSATYQFNALLGYVAPSLYGDIRAQLVKEVEQINHEHLSSVFYPSTFEIDIKHLSVKVMGQMKRFVGADLMSDVRETFLIRYSYEYGLLKLTNLEKV